MAFRISLGQYCAGNSFVHRLDPRAKLAIALIGMISVFFISNTAQLLFHCFTWHYCGCTGSTEQSAQIHPPRGNYAVGPESF